MWCRCRGALRAAFRRSALRTTRRPEVCRYRDHRGEIELTPDKSDNRPITQLVRYGVKRETLSSATIPILVRLPLRLLVFLHCFLLLLGCLPIHLLLLLLRLPGLARTFCGTHTLRSVVRTFMPEKSSGTILVGIGFASYLVPVLGPEVDITSSHKDKSHVKYTTRSLCQ